MNSYDESWMKEYSACRSIDEIVELMREERYTLPSRSTLLLATNHLGGMPQRQDLIR